MLCDADDGATSSGEFLAHKSRVTAAAALPAAGPASPRLLVTSGTDGASRLWRLNSAAVDSAANVAAAGGGGDSSETASGDCCRAVLVVPHPLAAGALNL